MMLFNEDDDDDDGYNSHQMMLKNVHFIYIYTWFEVETIK